MSTAPALKLFLVAAGTITPVLPREPMSSKYTCKHELHLPSEMWRMVSQCDDYATGCDGNTEHMQHVKSTAYIDNLPARMAEAEF